MDDAPDLRPWETLEEEELFRCRIFTIDRVANRSRSTGRRDDFFVMRSPDWVNVIALDVGGQAVLVRQFRHGTAEVTLEIPGGMIDAVDADPVEAGLRELREETGYAGGEATLIGTVNPNPSIQSNRCHTVLVTGVERVGEPTLDPNEEMETVILSLEEVGARLRSGGIDHALVVAAFHHLAARTDLPYGEALLGR